MTGRDDVSCEVFRDEVVDLAVGVAAAATNDRLLAHARECAACQALLDETTAVADHLLHLAPGREPPAGFEVRALAAMRAGEPGPGSARESRARAGRRSPALVAAAAVVLAALAGLAVGRATAPGAAAPRAGEVVAASGVPVGTVELSRVAGRGLIVLTMPEPATWPGTWTCELQSAGGGWVPVGSWRAEEVHGGVWATGIDRRLTAAAGMRIVDANGRVIATAALG